jgi:acyl dehydratase
VTLEPGATCRHVRRCDPYRPLYYAAASGDLNPIHVDAEAARAVGLPGLVLQGMCTYGWLAEACTGAAADPGALLRVSARFSRPVAPGDEVAFDVRCTAVEDGVAALEVAVTNDRGEAVLKDARAEVRVGPRPAAPPPAPAPGPAPATSPYGPYVYQVGVEAIRDFARALSGAVPTRLTRAMDGEPAPHPWHIDEDAARAGPHGVVIAPPTFAAVYAMPAFAAALLDPANRIDPLRALHGAQELSLHDVVRAGDRLTTHGFVASRTPKGTLELVTVETRTVNDRGALVALGRWTAAVR